MYIHRNTHTQTHVHTYTCTCTHTYKYIHADTCTDTHMYIHRHTHTHPIKSCSTSLFTHSAGYCTLGGGREHSTYSFLLLSLHSAIEQSDGSQCQ
ncbi:unnamed protein product [Staurois parvus]|uniref:Uncharacterized protein n=1 Tax=Staurois parvus TaxID=386267 RepID=A0ABN9DS17_9NEOB|nr:unnamed protein product [Staurois parvus]